MEFWCWSFMVIVMSSTFAKRFSYIYIDHYSYFTYYHNVIWYNAYIQYEIFAFIYYTKVLLYIILHTVYALYYVYNVFTFVSTRCWAAFLQISWKELTRLISSDCLVAFSLEQLTSLTGSLAKMTPCCVGNSVLGNITYTSPPCHIERYSQKN